jgi:two-component system KDP operon response regulator KdpE
MAACGSPSEGGSAPQVAGRCVVTRHIGIHARDLPDSKSGCVSPAVTRSLSVSIHLFNRKEDRAMRASVLVVDDDPQAARLVTSMLASRGYECRSVSDAESAMTIVAGKPPGLILTELEMPGMGGIDLCRRVRETSNIPMVVISANADCASEVAALDAGADDYIVKPFVADRLLARVRVALRRSTEMPEIPAIGVGEFHIDFEDRRVRVNGQPVRLTPKEFDLFVFMARHPNRVLRHKTLLAAVWGEQSEEQPEYLRVFMGQLRKKLESDPSNPRYLVTEPWVGYRFNPTGLVQ